MTKPANRRRGEIDLSEAGEGVFLRFSMDAMERLHSEYGDKYIDDVIQKMARVNPIAFKNVLECMIEGTVDMKECPWGVSWSELNDRVLDAIFIALHNETFKEHQETLEKRAAEEFEAAKTNPQKAVNLLSKLSSELGALPDSNQTTSEIIPPTKS